MYLIKRIFIWLRRIAYCRGFGVQSPTDYNFIRNVINEHYPYYAYKDLLRQLPNLNKEKRNLYELYFRIVNFRQPSSIIDFGCNTDSVFAIYCKAAKHAVTVIPVCSVYDFKIDNQIDIIRISYCSDYDSLYSTLMCHTDINSIWLVEGIYKNKKVNTFWNKLLRDQNVRIAFDLYYVGIVFFDKSRYKQHYIVNF